MKRRNLILAGGAMALTGGGLMFVRRDAPQAEEVAAVQSGDVESMPEMAIGAVDAPITMIEYGSFTCVHCANFHENVLPALKADFIDTGKMRFVFREVFFDRYGLWAAMIARCAGPEHYFGVSDILYAEQKAWIGSGDPVEIGENLRRIGLRAGLEADVLDACLADSAQAERMVANYSRQAQEDEITGTPSFIINGEKQPNMSLAGFREVLEGLHA